MDLLKPVGDGKTKTIMSLYKGSNIGIVKSKDTITAKDGKKRHELPGKGTLATRTTCNVFENFAARGGIPLAYVGRDGHDTFLTYTCDMIPVEVVGRWRAAGSYIKRHPEVAESTAFAEPIIEFFYKTKDCTIGDRVLPCDDPLMKFRDGETICDLYFPDRPAEVGHIGSLGLSREETQKLARQLRECAVITRCGGGYLDEAWKKLGGTFFDFKVEFGVGPYGEILMADVIDLDSWRVMWNDVPVSKQPYRDDKDLEMIAGIYKLGASLTDRFLRV